jgi:hypothetical protein
MLRFESKDQANRIRKDFVHIEIWTKILGMNEGHISQLCYAAAQVVVFTFISKTPGK